MKLSVITINLNNAAGLERTIKSVLDQTFLDYELIVVDGGSTDKSKSIIQKYSDRFSYWVSEPDTGVYQAQNKGILKASGIFCFFLNSGDYLVDNRVFEKVFRGDPLEDIIFGNLYVTIRDKVVGKTYGKEQLTFSDVYANMIKHQASFIKRSLFEQFGLFNEKSKIISDWEFIIKTVGFGNVSYRYIDLFISYFDNNGLSNKNGDIVHIEREKVIEEYVPLRMQKDYEYLLKFRRYERLYNNRFSYFIIRLLNKIIS